MDADIQGQHRARSRAPWLVLGVSLSLLLLANHALYLNLKDKHEKQFRLHVQDMQGSISLRMRRHEQILLGAAGFFDASGSVSRAEWKTYVERLRLEANYPGIQGVGYSQVIQPSGLAAHIRSVRAEGFPGYVVRPPGGRELYTSIVYLEPFRDRNLAAFGYDMFSEPTRHAAMRQAGETGATVISAKVRLVQETHGKAQAGFLMYVPVYHKGRSSGTPAERWRALRGFVYSPYRMDDLMRGAQLGGVRPVSFRIYDGLIEDEDALMYESDAQEGAPPPPSLRQAQFSVAREMQAYGHTWTINYQSRPDIEVGWFSRESVVLLVSGGAFSVLLFVLVAFLSARRDRAEALARAMTAEIRRNEEGLRQNEARLNEAQRTAQVGSWELDLATGQLHWSDEIFRLFKIDKTRFPATYEGFLNAIHPDDRDAVNQAYTESLAKRRPYEITHRLRMADGRIKWVHERCTSDFDDEGRPLRSRGTVQDITRQTEVERAATESAQFAQSILDHAVDGIITIDEKGVVQSFNKAAERIFGYAAQEVIARNVNILMPEPYHSEHDGYLEHYAQTGVKRIIGQGREVEGRRKDGSTFPMDLAVSHVARQGRPLFVGLVRDITERKRVDRMKSEFVSTVSHELRTPLTSIGGALGLVCGGALGPLPQQMQAMLDIAYKNSQRLTLLINDLLDMEKLVAGKMHFDMQEQALMPLVEQALENTQAYADQYRVELVLTGRAEGVRVRVDAGRLQQVLSNFLSNAAKFSPSGAQVDVAVRQQDGAVRVEVRDRGPGIPQEFRPRIFQKFSQADSSDTRQKGGTGLGLAISKELMEQMGGRVGFESPAGQGACFHLELPVVASAQSDSDRGAPPAAAVRLLVVEDDRDIAALMALMLTRAGYGVDIAGSTGQAMQMLQLGRYSAMTLDLNLPGQGGAELIQTLRSLPAFEKFPIVVVSACLDEGRLAINGDFAVADWLPKPIDGARLLAALRRSMLPAPASGQPRILLVEDDADARAILLGSVGTLAQVDVAESVQAGRQRLAQSRYDMVVLDVQLPDGNGLSLVPDINALQPGAWVTVLSVSELDPAQQDRVHQVLVKSMRSTEQLLATIRSAQVNPASGTEKG